MLDVIEQTTELPPERVETQPSLAIEFSEQQAREMLEQIDGERPSIRALAAAWGWHKSRVERFLKRLDEAKSAPEDTPTNRRKMLIAAAEDFNKRFPAETAEEAVDNAIAKGVVSLTPPKVDRPDDHWKRDNADLLFWDQPATVCYWNLLDQVVIKQQADPYEESDPFLRFAPENLPRLIARLQAIYAEWEQSR